MGHQKLRLITLLLLVILLIMPVHAQEIDPEGEAAFLEFELVPNFLPDPFIITALAGGQIDASALNLGVGCAGLIESPPDVRMNWVQGDEPMTGLRVFFVSDMDTTLVIQAPDGTFLCNDDNNLRAATRMNPVVDILEMMDGTYNIWIGSFSDELAGGYLMFTELLDTFPGQIVSSFLGTVIEP